MSPSKEDFSKICRMCLLFKKEMLPLQISEVIQMIRICINIEVELNDELPQTICLECSDQLHKYSAFRQLCRNSDEILHKIINDNNDASNDLRTNADADFSLADNVKETIFVSSNVKNEFENYIEDEPFDNEHTSYTNNANKNSTFTKVTTLETNLLTKKEVKDEKLFQDLDNFSNSSELEGNESNTKDEDIDHNRLNKETDSKNHVSDSENSSKITQGMVNCIVCNKYISTKTFKNHTKRHRQERKHKCDLCPRLFVMPCELARHLEITHRREKNIECQTCNKKFHLQVQLDLHLKTHMKKDNNCNVCGQEFTDNSNLLRHKRMHEEQVTVYCLHCGKTYTNEHNLKRHVKRSHNSSESGTKGKKMCPVCGKYVFKLKPHIMQIHDKYRPYKCNQCSKAFISNDILVRHVKEKHLGIKKEKKALCTVCGKSYPTQGDLRKHSEIHDDSRKYDCDLCNKTYKNKRSLQDHLMVHKGIQPVGCSFCSKRFVSRQQLKQHILIHTGEKPFACHICGRAFTQNGARQRHIMKVHNVFTESKDMLTQN